MHELQSQQSEVPLVPSPQHEEQHAAEVQHLQDQVQRLQEESATYRCFRHSHMRIAGVNIVQPCANPNILFTA